MSAAERPAPESGRRRPSTGERNAQRAALIAHALCGSTLDDAAEAEPTLVVMSPGSRHTPLALAFDREPSAHLEVVLDERAAAFVALGAARASGRPAIVLCTSGSAMGHYLPALMEASQARVPLIVVSADRPADLQHCGAAQTLSQTHAFERWTRLSLALPAGDDAMDPRWLRNMACRARAAAVGSPAGPVHINAPFRKPLYADSDESPPLALGSTFMMRGTLRLDRDAIERWARELERQERGVIVCGPLAPATLSADALADAVAALGRALAWPVLADPASGVRFRCDTIASYDALLGHPATAARLAPRRVLRIGQAPTSQSLERWLDAHARDAITLIDPDAQWHDPTHAAHALVVADPVTACHELAAALTLPARSSRWLDDWRRADALASAALRDAASQGNWEGRVAHDLVAALPAGAQLHIASSMPIRDVDTFAVGARRIAVHASRGCNGIDGTLSTLLGEALARPQAPTFGLLGDLALCHDLGGLCAWAAGAASAIAVVVNNDGGGIFEKLPIAQQIDRERFERLFATPQPLDVGAACRSLGIAHHSMDAEALPRHLDMRAGLTVLEVRVDRRESAGRREAALADVARALEGAW